LKIIGLILVLTGVSVLTYGQSLTDSTAQKGVTISDASSIGKATSVHSDSLSKPTQVPDSIKLQLLTYNRKLDSIRGKLTHRIDSLGKLHLPTAQYQHTLDSLQGAGPLKDVRQAESSLASLERKINQPQAKLSAEIQQLENKVSQKINGLEKQSTLPGSSAIPTTQIPGISGASPGLPTLPGGSNPLGQINTLENGGLGSELKEVSNAEGSLNKISSEPQQELNQLKNSGGLGEAGKEISEVDKVSAQAKGYSQDVQNISKGNMNEVKQLPQTLENKAMQMGEMKDFQSEVKVVDQYKGMAGGDPKAAEKLAMQQLQQQAVNHFAGREKELQSAMSQVGKYKQKYHNLSSIKNIPRHARNEMHGKPLIERLHPERHSRS
jgi:hypothetical protein